LGYRYQVVNIMNEKSKAILTRFTPAFSAWLKKVRLLHHKNSYLKTTGLFNSYKKGYPVNTSDEPLPWMNYSVISFLENRLNDEMDVFEYGSGFSTLFYARHVLSVYAVESDRNWYLKLTSMIPEKVTLKHIEFDYDSEYCRFILHTQKQFHLVVIDGRDRIRCSENCLNNLTDDGVIIFDDTERTKYEDGIRFLINSGFRKIDFEGLKAAGFEMHRTSIFYRDNNCLGI